MLLTDKWLAGDLGKIYPKQILATLSANCNLACRHCYWKHDTQIQPNFDLGAAVKQCQEFGNVPLIYCGRILNQTGARFLTLYHQQTGLKPSIIDNGWTILNCPELLLIYDQISISIDGLAWAHDWQRNKAGAFDKAWQTVLKLKGMGLDPVVATAVSKTTLTTWTEFEKLLTKHDIPLSCSIVWLLPATKKRGQVSVSKNEISKIFEFLISGIPKLINLYSTEQIEILMPILKKFNWQMKDTYFTTTLTNGIMIVYRPPSLVAISELDLLWDGKFYTTVALEKKYLFNKLDKSFFRAVNKKRLKEVAVWKKIIG